MNVFFELATWHAYAKLRLHTELTLSLFEKATRSLGATIRYFKKTTCEAYVTREIPQEQAACGRRTAALAAKRTGTGGKGKEKATPKKKSPTDKAGSSKTPSDKAAPDKASTGPKVKHLNLSTYKYHALGDYVEAIRRYGPTDNYNTQVVRGLVLISD